MCTSSRTPLEERRLLPSRLLLPTRDAVVSCAPARGLGWEISSLDQFYSVLPGLRRLGPNAPFIVWFSPGLVGAKLNRVWLRDAPLEKEPLHVAHVCSLAFVPFSTWRTCLVDAWFLPICCLLARVGRVVSTRPSSGSRGSLVWPTCQIRRMAHVVCLLRLLGITLGLLRRFFTRPREPDTWARGLALAAHVVRL